MVKNWKKQIALLLVTGMILVTLTGCSEITKVNVKEDGSVSSNIVLTMSQKLYTLLKLDASEEQMIAAYKLQGQTLTITDVTENGVASKKLTIEASYQSMKEYNNSLSGVSHMTLNANYAIVSGTESFSSTSDSTATDILKDLEDSLGGGSEDDAASQEIMAQMAEDMKTLKIESSYTFPYTVKASNGKIQSDGKTVTWTVDASSTETASDATMYALFTDNNSTTAPAFTGVVNNAYYKSGVTVGVNSENMIKQLDVTATCLKGTNTTTMDQLYLTKTGTYHVTATDWNGNKATISFMIDTMKPVVTGVKNNVTYKAARVIKFTDKNSGIQKATLNGVKIANAKKVSKKGSYVLKVYDKAGNVRIVKFKIK